MRSGCATSITVASGESHGNTPGRARLIVLEAKIAAVLLKTSTTASSSSPRCCAQRRIDTAKRR